MKLTVKISFLLLALGLAFAIPSYADEWSKIYSLSGRPNLSVETTEANIHVSTWDQNTIEAKVTTSHYKIGEGGIRIDEHQNGDVVSIEVHYPHHYFTVDTGYRRADIEIHMPREGKVDLSTSDGNIDLANFKGEMELRSSDGNETLNATDGNLRATTHDGSIHANGRFDTLELKSGDGSIEVRAENGSTLNNGWRLGASDGSIRLQVPQDFAADVDLHTHDGHIDLDMPVVTEGKLRENEVRGKLNGGGNLLTIHTGDGSIHLLKS